MGTKDFSISYKVNYGDGTKRKIKVKCDKKVILGLALIGMVGVCVVANPALVAPVARGCLSLAGRVALIA